MSTAPITPEEIDLEATMIYFAEEVLGFNLYQWQADTVTPFDRANKSLVQVSLVTPNGSGKSAVVIPTLVLGWLALYPKGRVVCTTADGKQLDSQVMPAIEAHRAKFPSWKFIERQITTPTGGRFVAFTTDDAGRAEGWHKLDDIDGPLLIICDEAKTIPEAIFDAIDRCTYNAILYTSSPGIMTGRFYESQSRPELGFVRIKAGLADCPHIPKDKINRIIKQHGPNSPFTQSALHGEFMIAEGETRFDSEGLELLLTRARERFKLGKIGVLEEQQGLGNRPQWMLDPENGWIWKSEDPIPGCKYVAFADPNTGEQGQGSKNRDSTACGILRDAYMDSVGMLHNAALVAAIHVKGGCKWDMDIVSQRLHRLAKHYGDCMTIIEANNYGGELIRLMRQSGATLWRREKINAISPGKRLEVYGFMTSGANKALWTGALSSHIREQSLDCDYLPACQEFSTFIVNESGTGEAQSGYHDDWVSGVGLGLLILSTCGTTYIPQMNHIASSAYGNCTVFEEGYARSTHGACN